jgi:hypothetical protein
MSNIRNLKGKNLRIHFESELVGEFDKASYNEICKVADVWMKDFSNLCNDTSGYRILNPKLEKKILELVVVFLWASKDVFGLGIPQAKSKFGDIDISLKIEGRTFSFDMCGVLVK